MQTKRRARGIIATLAMIVVGFIGLLGLPALAPGRAEAHGTYVPSHAIGNWYYDSYGLAQNPPKYMRPYRNVNCQGFEWVYWSPDLYRWNGSTWALYNGSAPWYHAGTGIYGYCPVFSFGGYWADPNGYTHAFYRYGRLPVGYYAIKNSMYWRSINRSHAQWSDVFRLYSMNAGSKAAAKTNGWKPPAPTRANSDGARKTLPSSKGRLEGRTRR